MPLLYILEVNAPISWIIPPPITTNVNPLSNSYWVNVSQTSKTVSIDLFCSSTAAKHLAPSIPNEFFLIDPY